MTLIRLLLLSIFLSGFCLFLIPLQADTANPAAPPVYAAENKKPGSAGQSIVVYGKQYRLVLYDASGNVIKQYPVGIGLNGMGKTREGDKKTPVGKYRIIWKASRFAKTDGGYLIRDGYAFAGPDNIFTTDSQIGYSSEQLWTAGYGGNKAVVMMLDYPNQQDRSRGCTGACIEIHATLLGGIGEKSSAGCVRMHPEDARDLYNRVPIGTPVTIKNE